VRFDPENAKGVCAACHMMLDGNPYVHTEYARKRLGSERFEQLNIRAMSTVKIDREAIKANLKEKLALLEVKHE